MNDYIPTASERAVLDRMNAIPDDKRDLAGRVAFANVAERVGAELVTGRMVCFELVRMLDAGEIG